MEEEKKDAVDATPVAGPKKKKKTISIVLTIIEIICIIAFVVSGIFVVKYILDEKEEDRLAQEMEEDAGDESDKYDTEVVIDEDKKPAEKETKSDGTETGSDGTSDGAETTSDGTSDGSETKSDAGAEEETKQDKKEETTDKSTVTLHYLTGKNIAKLNKKSSTNQIVAWMQVTGFVNTQIPQYIKTISQPVAQGTDNEFYLDHDAYGAENEKGAVYVDCRGDMENILNNKNLIIYAHAKSYSRFGILKALNLSSEWAETEEYQYVYLQTATETTIWRIFSWYLTDKNAPYRNTYFDSDEDFVDYCNDLQSKNTIKGLKSYNFTEDDVIMTMSTCKGVNSDVRVAIHAVLVAHAYLADLEK